MHAILYQVSQSLLNNCFQISFENMALFFIYNKYLLKLKKHINNCLDFFLYWFEGDLGQNINKQNNILQH